MDVKQLNALLTVAETGSVTRAAQLLHLVQSAVTRQVQALEDELGVQLFERTRTGMLLTEAGSRLAETARHVMTELERAEAEVRQNAGTVQGIVAVGLLESVSDLVAEPLVARLARTHPQVELRLYTAFAGHLRQWLYDGTLDVALLFGITDPSAISVTPLATEALWAVAPPDARLSPDRPVPYAEVARHPVIAPARGNGLRTLLEEVAARAGTTARVAIETNSARVQKQLVAKGHGWAVLPAICVADEVSSRALSMAALDDPDAQRQLVLAMPRSRRRSAATEVVARSLVALLRDAAEDGRWPSVQWQAAQPSQGAAQLVPVGNGSAGRSGEGPVER
ncbi:LysR substrate-binding domain-containing protein [Streptomyces sp. T12]|uniref:LysR family transcriptional regulator n=1 Tax=Streptomyces sp. T12 TaxID=477697 RepID=UPI00119DB2DA|nr:LysR substrate-binding domain-containing protein [Streptomyces sp. T12]